MLLEFLSKMRDEQFRSLGLFAALWVHFAMPVISVSQEQVSSLSQTDSDPNVLASDVFAPPWPAFYIRLAEESFPVVLINQAESAAQVFVSGITVTFFQGLAYDPGEGRMPFQDGYCEIKMHMIDPAHGHAVTLDSGPRKLGELYAEIESDWDADGSMSDTSVLEKRAQKMAYRLVLSAIVSMNVHGRRRVALSRAEKRVKRFSRFASREEFVLGTPVSIDAREELWCYLTGRASAVHKTRWVVRGHWRNQPRGPQRAERLLTWIAPHWSGHSAAPKLVKTYQLGSGKKAKVTEAVAPQQVSE